MGFVAVCTAIYNYSPQGEGELDITEGELLYVLEKGTDDDWWKAKKRANDEDEEEPEGLIPNNYVEDAKPISSAKALYDYSRQTDEEVSFSEDAALEVYDTSDPDWTLVGVNGDFGFAPANYIELSSTAPKSPTTVTQPTISPAINSTASPEPSSQIQSSGPAANLARVLGGGAPRASRTSREITAAAPPPSQLTPEASDAEEEEQAPALPQRPPSQTLSSPPTQYASPRDVEPSPALPSPPSNSATSQRATERQPSTSGSGFHLYNVSEMVSALGKRKKMPTSLGLNVATGTIMLSPERSRDGPPQEWTADKMTHYSIEGKHVFLELIRPSKSLDLHAGSKDIAEEIVATLGEIAGAFKGEGLREIIAAATGAGGQKTGQVLYDFMAQGDDEVTVAIGDEVLILDDQKSEEWWNVRRLKNGKEGVVPSSYVEITGTLPTEPPSRIGVNAGRSKVEQNRLEEERLAREAAKSQRASGNGSIDAGRPLEVGPGMKLPQRGSSLADDDTRRTSKRDKRSSRSEGKSSRSKPDPNKTRTWTDHSGSFKVDAQFIGLAEGKIHLHKQNGVKIAVPVGKMSPEDLEYVEKATGESLEEYLPVAVLMDRKKRAASGQKPKSGASTGQGQPKSDYDWFDFFLAAGVNHYQCERYAQAMVRDSMDESVLRDITPDVLRTLGLKEGDAIKVMKYLDQKYGRTRSQTTGEVTNGDPTGGIFSGPGGALYNNTRRGRPEANRQTSDVVDAKALQSPEPNGERVPSDTKATPLVGAPKPEKQLHSFDDDAWEVKPPKLSAATTSPPSRPPASAKPPPLSGAMAELSLLTPLEPTIQTQPAQPQQRQEPGPPAQASSVPQPQPVPQTGANPSFFSQLPPQTSGFQNANQTQYLPQNANPQQMSMINPPRQRPQPPINNFGGNAALAPPPRPLSAPQNQQQSHFGLAPLQPQLTGFVRPAPPGQSMEEIAQQRLQQQYFQQQQQQQQQQLLQAQQTGFAPQQGYGGVQGPNGQMPQPTGFYQQQPFLTNGNAYGSPFADPGRSFAPPMGPQPTGYGQSSQPGGINSILPPALQPQRTAFQQPPQQQPIQIQPQATAFQQPLQTQFTGYQQQQQQTLQQQPTGFQPQSQFGQQQMQQNGFGNNFQAPPVPSIPQQHTLAPLQPQKTGPAPPVRFGVDNVKKLAPQPTGRRANLSNASRFQLSNYVFYANHCSKLLTIHLGSERVLELFAGSLVERHVLSCGRCTAQHVSAESGSA